MCAYPSSVERKIRIWNTDFADDADTRGLIQEGCQQSGIEFICIMQIGFGTACADEFNDLSDENVNTWLSNFIDTKIKLTP